MPKNFATTTATAVAAVDVSTLRVHASPANDEIQMILKHTYGDDVSLRGDRCVPTYNMHGRGTSMVATGFLLEFIVDQVRLGDRLWHERGDVWRILVGLCSGSPP